MLEGRNESIANQFEAADMANWHWASVIAATVEIYSGNTKEKKFNPEKYDAYKDKRKRIARQARKRSQVLTDPADWQMLKALVPPDKR